MTKGLFDPVKLGDISLNNRIVMAPLTRGRAGVSRTANDLMREYYTQRASAGLIITEATAISAQGYGWFGAPALYTDTQEQGWTRVVQSVHRAAGKIVLQMWHMGRVSHPDFLDGALPVGPSAIAAKGDAHTSSGKKPYVTPRALETGEIGDLIDDYVAGARRAINAGFDGVEIHAANGYLLDQFLRDGSNRRDDRYGGSIENRIRLPLEIVQAVCDEIGAGRVGIRVSPTNSYNDMRDSTPVETYTALAYGLNAHDLAYLHVMEPTGKHFFASPDQPYVTPHIHAAYKGALIVNGGYDARSADDALKHDKASAVAFGVPFIANPDLVERFRTGAKLNLPKQETFYTEGANGYTDYPFLKDAA